MQKTRAFMDLWRGKKSGAIFASWRQFVSDSLHEVRHKIAIYQRFVLAKTARLEAESILLLDEWVHFVEDEQDTREELYEKAKSEHARQDEIESLKKRHHAELGDWRREFEGKLKDYKEKLKSAEDSLKPLQIWRWYATWSAFIGCGSFSPESPM